MCRRPHPTPPAYFVPHAMSRSQINRSNTVERESISTHSWSKPDERYCQKVERMSAEAKRSRHGAIQCRSLRFRLAGDSTRRSQERLQPRDAAKPNLANGLNEADKARGSHQVAQNGARSIHLPDRFVGQTHDKQNQRTRCENALRIKEYAVEAIAVLLPQQSGGGSFGGVAGQQSVNGGEEQLRI